MSYRFDPSTRELVQKLLWEHIPAWYRVRDEPPTGRNDLRRLLNILSVPLSIARQNVEELHTDLFIDTSNDWVIPYLAQMVGVTLVFPDAVSNRIDVRETVGWRRRKGTPAMLNDLATSLTRQLAATQEGWKLVAMTQDLNLLRMTRVVPDIRPAIVAEIADGPLATLHHAVDLRAISRKTGRYHPKHVFHYVHPTQLFEVNNGVPASQPDPLAPQDIRFSFTPLGEYVPLRVRRVGEELLLTDRVPPLHFAVNPGNWFDRPGNFSVRTHGIAAAVAAPSTNLRNPARQAAPIEIAAGSVDLTLLEHDPRRFRGPIQVEVAAVGLAGALPNPAQIDVRSRFELDAAGAANFTVVNAGALDPAAVVMIRLQPVGAGGRFFPGATIEIASDAPSAALATFDSELARDGFLQGALAVRLPATRVIGDRWFYLAADGSVYDAQSTGTGPADIAIENPAGPRTLQEDTARAAGPGAAWPPLDGVSDPEPFTRLPTGHNAHPAVLHGGRVFEDVAGSMVEVPGGTQNSLVLAASYFTASRQYEPFLRLAWAGPGPAAAAGAVIDSDGSPAADPAARLAAVAALRDTTPNQFQLVVRFESAISDAVMAPSEVAITSWDGVSVLAYLPQLTCAAGSPVPGWSLQAPYTGASPGVNIAEDGSAWNDGTTVNARRSLGQVAPMAQYRALRRRRVHARLLCPWRNETAVLFHDPTPEGHLDIDVSNGLFAFALSEPVDEVTVMYQEGYTRHTGARTAPREPELDMQLRTPTRLVSASGHLHRGAPSSYMNLPRYASLEAALAAVAAGGAAVETIQFEDSWTYTGEDITWPANCQTLTIQATEGERPAIRIDSMASDPNAEFELVSLIGLNFGSDAIAALPLPPSQQIEVLFCTVHRAANILDLTLVPSDAGERADVRRSVTGPLRLNTSGTLRIEGSVVDAGAGTGADAITANSGTTEVERSTVFGIVATLVLEASEVIFNDDVFAIDRFRGCVRYSRVTSNSELPRQHRTVVDIEPRYVSVNRPDAAHARLAESCPREILRGAEDGSEMGAFHDLYQAQRYEGLLRRLMEYTPAGLETGIIRMD